MARLGQIIKTLNIGIGTAVDFLNKKGENISPIPHQQLTETQENLLLKEFSSDKTLKEKSDKLIQKRQERENLVTVEVESIEKTSVTQNKTTVEEVDKIEKQKVEKKKTVTKSEEEEDLTRKDKNVIKHAQTDENINTEQRKKSKKKTEKDELPADEDNIGSKDKDNIEIKESVKEPVVKGTNESEQELQSEKYSDVLVQQTDSLMIDKSLSDREISVVDADIDYQPQGEEHETQIFKYSEQKLEAPKVLGTINLDKIGKDSRPQPKTREERKKEYKEMVLRKREEEKRIKAERQKATEKSTVKAEPQKNEQMRVTERRKEDFIKTNVPILQGPKIVDKVNIEPEKPIGKSYADRDKTRADSKGDKKSKEHRKRDRIKIERIDITEDRGSSKSVKSFKKDRRNNRNPIDIEDVNQNIRETLAIAREGRKFNKKAVDYRKEKRENIRQEIERQVKLEMAQSKILTLTEFVTVNELASMMQVPVNDVIKVYMNLGMFVGINQRVDAESIKIVADEFGFETNFVSAEAAKNIEEDEADDPQDLVSRPPIITVMGHVDHGKTSLLDYIRQTNVIAGEAGGITQHIGAYNVKLEDGRQITFIDTPGHEAFTAMRARGAKVTDIAIIIVAADDDVMPQTIEAINHAASANVPIVFAINKIDKDGADPEKIKATLANMNYMVESWGGKYQSQDISAKKGIGIKELLEKVLLESEILDLKANPKRKAIGSVIDVRKDKGRGNEITLLVQNGTLRQGDIVLAGYAYGKIRAMFNERNQPIKEAKPSEPVLVLGIKGELQAGDNFNVMETEQAAREIIAQRDQLKREQKLRTSHHLTLDEIGRRIAQGNFQEFNIIVKGDVDGSIEALSDSLIKLSTSEIQVNVIHKGIGQITEGDVNLAISSNAIIVGFQVRPTSSARQLADNENVDIRIYSIIYQAIDEIKSAMEGMLIPEKSEKVVATLEVRNTFHISKVGTIAGCFVKDGTIKRNNKVRVIHDGIVVHTGEIASLKHEKDDVREIKQGYECGINIANFNTIDVGDIIEAFEEIEIKKTLE